MIYLCFMKKQKVIPIILGSIQAIIATGAIPAGILYLTDTTGAKMGATPSLLEHSPLDSFLLPGLFLLLVKGLATAIAAALSFMRHRYAGIAALLLGIVLIVWIIIQVWWIGFLSFLQPVILAMGMAEAVMGMMIKKNS